VGKDRKSIRVLLVEDDQAARDGYATYLTNEGYQVLTAGTGQETLTLMTRDRVDIVVLDLGLPDIDGWEVARRLKAAPQTANVPIIALTGSGLPHERVSAMRAGCDRHLTKPCAPTELLEAIEHCANTMM
jgi:CheY-like chemotaxis protein